MTRRTTAIAAALSLLPLGQPLVLGSTTALATGAVLLSSQAADAQSAQVFIKHGYGKIQLGDYQGAIAQSLLPLRQGMIYSKAHQVMVDAGWQMFYTYNNCMNPRFPQHALETCWEYPNLIECSAGGFCLWGWVNSKGKRVNIVSLTPGPGVKDWEGRVRNWWFVE